MDLSALMQPQKISMLVVPLLVFLATVLVGSIVRKILFNRLVYFTRNTKTQIDDIIIAATKGPFMIWCVMLGIYWALEASQLSARWVELAGKIMKVLWSLSVTIVASNITTRMIKVYADRVEGTLPVSSITQNIARILIFGTGVLVILHNLGIAIGPILATLGVGGLAVALALQETLSNFFAGIHIIAMRQIKVGDFIKLESGQEGYIVDINWRTTKIRMLPNNVVLIPNSKLTQTIVINYYMPDKELAVLVDLGVHYDSDLQRVEKVTIEVAREVMREVKGGVPGFEPFIRFHTFGDFSINFSVIMRGKEFTDQYLIKHEFVKRLHARYAAEKIVIPYPIRAINYAQEKAS